MKVDPRITTPLVAAQHDPECLEQAASILRRGGLVAFPTETVYGLGADATNDRAVARLFEAKGRPRFNPLIMHVATLDQARALGRFGPLADRLARAFWPGPLTLVLERTTTCAVGHLACAGLDSIALRLPAHRLARALLEAIGRPIAAPSANRSGHVSPTLAAHVAADLGGRVDLILDGGPCPLGIESTIVRITGEAAHLLRPGGLAREDIAAVLGAPLLEAGPCETPDAPGQLTSHYAPRAALRLNARRAEPDEILLGFGPQSEGEARLNLSPGGNLREAAANLFAMLRALDDSGAARIAVAPVPKRGLGLAINDRLARASAPRENTP